MKIIGKTENGLLISATETEVANLIGFYYRGADGCPRLEPGLEIVIGAMYKQLEDLRVNRKQLGGMAGKLRAIADTLELSDPVLQKLTAPEETNVNC